MSFAASSIKPACRPPIGAEGLNIATYLLNIFPTKTLHAALHGVASSYTHLCAFGCKCYPNLSAMAPHKLAPLSSVFHGNFTHHKGYRCLEIDSNQVVISHHVIRRGIIPLCCAGVPWYQRI